MVVCWGQEWDSACHATHEGPWHVIRAKDAETQEREALGRNCLYVSSLSL